MNNSQKKRRIHLSGYSRIIENSEYIEFSIIHKFDIHNIGTFDTFLLEKFKFIYDYKPGYIISDDELLSLFMLKYPEYIQNISYE
jgi:hypothetical protein